MQEPDRPPPLPADEQSQTPQVPPLLAGVIVGTLPLFIGGCFFCSAVLLGIAIWPGIILGVRLEARAAGAISKRIGARLGFMIAGISYSLRVFIASFAGGLDSFKNFDWNQVLDHLEETIDEAADLNPEEKAEMIDSVLVLTEFLQDYGDAVFGISASGGGALFGMLVAAVISERIRRNKERALGD